VGLGNKPAHEFREEHLRKTRKAHIKRRQQFYELAEIRQRELSEKYSTDPGPCTASLTDVFDGNAGPIYEDFGHLFDEGNRIVAERIALELERCDLIMRRLKATSKTKPAR
jgi:hypothetical protein